MTTRAAPKPTERAQRQTAQRRLVGGVVAVTLAFVLRDQIWGQAHVEDLVLHAAAETLGSLAAIITALLLLQQDDARSVEDAPAAAGLLAMGIFDGLHALTTPGNGFVLLHTAGTLAGAAGFALVWVPVAARRPAALWRRWIPIAVSAGALALGAAVVRWPDAFPSLAIEGGFSPAAVGLHWAAGALFLASAPRFFISFRSSRRTEHVLFGSMGLLFGTAALLFALSSLWDGPWWSWHAVRLASYLLALGLSYRRHAGAIARLRRALEEQRGAQEDLQSLNASLEERVEERTAELEADNFERRCVEQALVESKNLLSAVIEGTSDIVFVVDRDEKVLFVNRAGARALNRPIEDVRGKRTAEIFPPEALPALGDVARRVLESGETVTFDQEIAVSDVARAFLTTNAPYRNANGEIVGTIGVGHDITERKRAEEAEHFLSEASKALASSIDYPTTLRQVAHLAVPRLADFCAIQIAEPDGPLRAVKTVCDEAGEDEVAEGTACCCRVEDDGASERVMCSGASELASEVGGASGAATDADAEPAAPRHAIIRSRITVPLLAEGKALGVITFAAAPSRRRYGPADLALFEEVGRRAALAITNARLYGAAQRAIHTREDLLAVVSHDLRNPLNAIMLSATMLGHIAPPGAEGEPVRQKADQIERSVTRMTHLIGDLLDAAAIEAGRFPVTRERHEAASLAAEVLEIMQPMARERGLRLEWCASGPLPDLDCDRDRVLQVFSNLVGNALKFTKEGGSITISAEREGDAVRFAVSDTGAGIPEETVAHLFDRYWQASHARRAGVGLGLYIVKGIVEAHGQSIWVESRLGVGSTFFFGLPVATRPVATDDAHRFAWGT